MSQQRKCRLALVHLPPPQPAIYNTLAGFAVHPVHHAGLSPDPAAVGQQLADVAADLARRGHSVTVFTADRGYDDPSIRYSRNERRDGVRVIRLPWSSFGKRSMLVRSLGGISFLLQATFRALFARGVTHIVVTTVPPMSPFSGAVLAMARSAGVIYWIMDLNPDQLLELGVVRRESAVIRVLDWFHRTLLRRAAAVIVCDHYMAARVRARFDPEIGCVS